MNKNKETYTDYLSRVSGFADFTPLTKEQWEIETHVIVIKASELVKKVKETLKTEDVPGGTQLDTKEIVAPAMLGGEPKEEPQKTSGSTLEEPKKELQTVTASDVGELPKEFFDGVSTPTS